MNGYDETSSVMSLAKNLLQQCEGEPDKLILEKSQLKLVLKTFIQIWTADQDRKRESFKKAANG